MPGTPDEERPLVDRRLTAILDAAALHHTALSLDEVASLLPADAPETAAEVHEWIATAPHLAQVRNGTVSGVHATPPPIEEMEARRSRGESYWEAARGLLEDPLRPAMRLVRCAGITGSTAYREPLAGDDLDLMAITRPATVWLFLALAFGRLRWGRRASAPPGSHWCLNYVVDERTARHEYGRPQGFLFAREALTARILQGGSFYHELLRSSSWMETELPRLYRRTMSTAPAPESAPSADGLVARAASLFIFPFLATYLQLAGLVRNHRLRRAGRSEETFRTETRWGRFALLTRKYDRLSTVYFPASLHRPSEVPA